MAEPREEIATRRGTGSHRSTGEVPVDVLAEAFGAALLVVIEDGAQLIDAVRRLGGYCEGELDAGHDADAPT